MFREYHNFILVLKAATLGYLNILKITILQEDGTVRYDIYISHSFSLPSTIAILVATPFPHEDEWVPLSNHGPRWQILSHGRESNLRSPACKKKMFTKKNQFLEKRWRVTDIETK